MPAKLTNIEKIRRAHALIDEATPICAEIPRLEGQKRGQAVRKARSRLGNAERWVSRMASDPKASSDNRREANRIIAQVDRMWPAVL